MITYFRISLRKVLSFGEDFDIQVIDNHQILLNKVLSRLDDDSILLSYKIVNLGVDIIPEISTSYEIRSNDFDEKKSDSYVFTNFPSDSPSQIDAEFVDLLEDTATEEVIKDEGDYLYITSTGNNIKIDFDFDPMEQFESLDLTGTQLDLVGKLITKGCEANILKSVIEDYRQSGKKNRTITLELKNTLRSM